MQNFNTNQTRFFYVASQINANVYKDRNAADSAAATNLDIAVSQAETGEFYFFYKNNDGLITRSDSIDPKKVVCVKKTGYAALDKALLKHTITIKSPWTYTALKSKSIKLTVTVHQVFDYDDSNSRSFTVFYDVPSTLASAQALYEALDAELDKVLPTKYATITSSSGGLVLTEAMPKYVRGKLAAEACPLSVSFDVVGESNPEWGADAITASSSKISGSYALADLEYFAAGEKGDYYRGSVWPNDYPFNPAIALGTNYDVLTVEYYWAGEAENVQKSPRIIQIAAPSSGSVIDTLYSSVISYAGISTGSGSGA